MTWSNFNVWRLSCDHHNNDLRCAEVWLSGTDQPAQLAMRDATVHGWEAHHLRHLCPEHAQQKAAA